MSRECEGDDEGESQSEGESKMKLFTDNIF